MAKKVLTPEEVKAKMEKKSAKRKLFFGTFTKALAFFLAIAMAYSLATIAFTPATVATTGGAVQSGEQTGGVQSGDVQTGDVQTGDVQTGDTPTGDAPSTDAPSTDTPSTDTPASDDKPANDETATYVKALNDATKKAAGASYKWERTSIFSEPLKVLDEDGKDASGTLNTIIALVDENATVDTVVGNFLDMTKEGAAPKTAEVTKGKNPDGMKEKFLLKATTLSASDVTSATLNGNTYTFTIATLTNPQKDNKNALHRATNDFVTIGEVKEGVANGLGSFSSRIVFGDSTVVFNDIKIVAEIVDGTLKNFTVSYEMDVQELNLTADLLITKIPIVGQGKGTMVAKYTNFKY